MKVAKISYTQIRFSIKTEITKVSIFSPPGEGKSFHKEFVDNRLIYQHF
jgi:hypothetical protein